MKKILVSLAVAALFLTPFQSIAKTIRVAVIDTGISSLTPKLCSEGHKALTGKEPLKDEHGHGTHVAGLINDYAGSADYCLVAIKFYDPTANGAINLRHMIDAIDYAISLKVDLINISGGGPEASGQEKEYISKALDNGIKVVVAAGNSGQNLSHNCDYYPACYDKRIIVVGNLSEKESPSLMSNFGYSANRAPSSNYGRVVTRWEVGVNVTSACVNGRHACRLSGTSQAAAIASGKIVKEMFNHK